MDRWQELESKYFMTTGKRQPITLVRGEGVRVWDSEGVEYLDFVGGWAVTGLGHCHPVIVKALEKQGRTLWQVSNQFYTVPQVELAELLVRNSCMDRIFIGNSGAEANEAAVKLARKYGKVHLDGAYEVITTLNSFHGRTLAMVAATGQPHYQEPYTPLPQGFINVPFDDVEAIMSATTENTCAVMLEPIQGEGGVNLPSQDYLKQVREWCDQQGLLLMFDEVQTGLGRIGTLFAYQQFGVEPDVMTLAKGLGGGIPIGAILAKEKASVFTPGDHGSTYGGNPLASAVALAATRYFLEEDVLGNVCRVGALLEGEAGWLGPSIFLRQGGAGYGPAPGGGVRWGYLGQSGVGVQPDGTVAEPHEAQRYPADAAPHYHRGRCGPRNGYSGVCPGVRGQRGIRD